MPDMAQEEYEALKTDIAERGVLIPIEYDESGNVLDGHHRLKACAELGITDYPKITRTGMTETEKRTHARKLNMARRHLSREQRRELIKRQLIETPNLSDRQIAKILGVSNSTVSVMRWELIESGQVCDSHTSKGADGKEYKRHHENKEELETIKLLEETRILTYDDLNGIKQYVASITDIKECEQVIDILKPLKQELSESILDCEYQIRKISNAIK